MTCEFVGGPRDGKTVDVPDGTTQYRIPGPSSSFAVSASGYGSYSTGIYRTRIRGNGEPCLYWEGWTR